MLSSATSPTGDRGTVPLGSVGKRTHESGRWATRRLMQMPIPRSGRLPCQHLREATGLELGQPEAMGRRDGTGQRRAVMVRTSVQTCSSPVSTTFWITYRIEFVRRRSEVEQGLLLLGCRATVAIHPKARPGIRRELAESCRLYATFEPVCPRQRNASATVPVGLRIHALRSATSTPSPNFIRTHFGFGVAPKNSPRWITSSS